jgi:hypothetical protein
MLGLGSNISKTGKLGVHDLGIVTSNLVLKHNYDLSGVEPLSSGAADINADAAANEYIDVGVIPITTNDVTISAWVYITTWVNYAPIFSNRSASGTNPGIELRCANGAQKLQLLIDDANGSSSAAMSSTLNSNQWYHVCGVWDRSGDMSLYIDGVLDGTDDITGHPLTLTHSTSAKIGATGSTEMRGYVCNVGYWNAALSQPQIKSIMNKNYDSLSASEKTDLVSWWNLDSVIPDTTTLVYDNYHGGGEILGDELVNCVGFDCADPAAVWSEGSGWSFSGGKAIYDGTGGTSSISQADVIEVGKTYRVSVEVLSNEGSGSNTMFLGGTILSSSHLSVGTHVFYGATSNTSVSLHIYGRSGEVFEIGSFSVKEINGNTGTLS